MKFGNIIGTVALLVGLYFLWRLRFVVLLAFTAVAFATVLNRVVRQLAKWGMSRGLAILITLMFLLAVATGISRVVVPPFVGQANQWLAQLPQEAVRANNWLYGLRDQLPPEVYAQLQQLDTLIRDIPQIVSRVFSNLFVFFRGALSLSLNTLLVLVLTIMLLANPRSYRNAFVALFPRFYRHRLKEILDLCETSLVGWGIGILFNMSVISFMSFAGLAIIGVPLPIGNALIAGLMTFVPNVGPVLSVIPPAILGLIEAPWKAVAVVVLYIIIQQVESNILTPLVMKHQVALLPAIALIAQLVCGILFGLLGLFLALPLAVAGQIMIQEILIKDIMDNWRKRVPPSERPSL